ncbi:GNAT family N-acetyltransferase [Sphingomonas kaistensis]|uniref:GNAT family N-acetyltransferase n=1 Tax=Sphingomonas kaistensis TaxID=298708 RepID=A0ABZ2FWF5_9SPHN
MTDGTALEQIGIPRVRRALVTDAPILARLNAAVQTLHVTLYPDRFQASPEVEKVEAYLSRILQLTENVFGICETAQGATGYIWVEEQVRPASPFTNAFARLYVHHLVVEHQAREQGVATALLNWAYQHARERGITEIGLDHWEANSGAHRFFERRGFEVERVIMMRRVPRKT